MILDPAIWVDEASIRWPRRSPSDDWVMDVRFREANEVVVEHARRALIHELGVRRVEVWRGKDGPADVDAQDLASIVIASLEPILTPEPMAEVFCVR